MTSSKNTFDNLVFDELKKGPLNTYEIRALGPFHPAGVISRLRKIHSISSDKRVTVTDGQGVVHTGVALYELENNQGGVE